MSDRLRPAALRRKKRSLFAWEYFLYALKYSIVALERSLAGTQNWFIASLAVAIASLAVSDILVGLFIMPLSLTNELLGYWPFGSVLCDLWLSTCVTRGPRWTRQQFRLRKQRLYGRGGGAAGE